MPAKATKPTKAGHSAGAAKHKRRLFAEAYMRNGQNATQAAREAGYGGADPRSHGHDLLHHPEVERIIEQRSRRVAELAEMKTETWAREVSRLAFSSIGDLVDDDGDVIPIHALSADVQAAIASVDVAADGTVKYKFWDKNAALQTMARHLGLFEKDNRQREDIRVVVELKG